MANHHYTTSKCPIYSNKKYQMYSKFDGYCINLRRLIDYPQKAESWSFSIFYVAIHALSLAIGHFNYKVQRMLALKKSIIHKKLLVHPPPFFFSNMIFVLYFDLFFVMDVTRNLELFCLIIYKCNIFIKFIINNLFTFLKQSFFF